MTVQEFSDQFDVLYNNITSNQALGLNEYEKSVFLTKAQDEVVKNYFSPNSQGNTLQQGFDGNAKRQVDFSMLMRTVEGSSVSASVNIHSGNNTGYYAMPSNIFLYINEVLQVKRGGVTCNLTVVPMSYQDYDRLMSKPFKRPLKNQAWRLITSGAASSYTYIDYAGLAAYMAENEEATATSEQFFAAINGKNISTYSEDDVKYVICIDATSVVKPDATLASKDPSWEQGLGFDDSETGIIAEYLDKTVSASSTVVELIPGPNDTIQNYIIRYVARPRPIILTDLTNESLTVNGESAPHDCELDPILHEEILQRAVELAKVAWTANGQDNAQMVIQAGQRSE